MIPIYIIAVLVLMLILLLAVFCASFICCYICYQRGLRKGTREVVSCSVTRPVGLEEQEEVEDQSVSRPDFIPEAPAITSPPVTNTRPINTPSVNNIIWTDIENMLQYDFEATHVPQPGAIQSNV